MAELIEQPDPSQPAYQAFEVVPAEPQDKPTYSQQVKMKDGYHCTVPGCGEMDQELLEANHVYERRFFPELAQQPEFGKTKCLWHHAFRHRRIKRIRNMILARLAIIFMKRYKRDIYEKWPMK